MTNRYSVECFETTTLFERVEGRPVIFRTQADAAWAARQPKRLVVTLDVECEKPSDAADLAFEIGNAPWEPTDERGIAWPHGSARSLSSGDVVIVRGSGPATAIVCMSFGWQTVTLASVMVPATE